MSDKLYKAFTGSEVEVLLLKGELEANGIECLTREGVTFWKPGFYFGAPASLDLFTDESNRATADELVKEFVAAQDTAE